MIQTEKIEINGKLYTKTFSDQGYYIIDNQTKVKYEVAFNPIHKTHTYLETSELIKYNG